MTDLAPVEIERDVADAAARRAAEQGLTVTAYISLLLRRSFERVAGTPTLATDAAFVSKVEERMRELIAAGFEITKVDAV